MWTLVWSYIPILLLIYLMTKKNSMPSHAALPLVALLLYLVMLIVFEYDPNLIHATVVKGLLVAWTPILIVAGAIFLFRTMEATGALTTISNWLNNISENKVAQMMIVGWAFPFLIEGASGFGTPAAIAAPILVGLGFPALRVAVVVLIMNSVPVSFGAVGTPTWFGFSELSLTDAETLEMGYKSAVMNSAAALIVPPIALLFIFTKKEVIKNIVFIVFSVLATVLPYIAVSRYNYEFPSLVGGTVGLIVSVILAKLGIGLWSVSENNKSTSPSAEKNTGAERGGQPKPVEVTFAQLLKATFPLWGTLALLVVTRIPALHIKGLLTLPTPSLSIALGSFGTFHISPSLVVSLTDIFNTAVNWSHSILYVPSLLPFGLISVITFLLFKKEDKLINTLKKTVHQMKTPMYALLGALVFVNLMMMGENAPVTRIGNHLASLTGHGWQFAAPYLGAVGSFFSGSNTISNLTFGGIQDAIAKDLGLNRTTILALQSVGGAMGNMICINNIVAVASVLALGNIEGYILKRTVRVVVIYGIIAALVSQLL